VSIGTRLSSIADEIAEIYGLGIGMEEFAEISGVV
jgi:hypothetical protein